METTTNKVECDFCECDFDLERIYNVENIDGTLNVLCDNCLEENPENVLWAWRSID